MRLSILEVLVCSPAFSEIAHPPPQMLALLLTPSVIGRVGRILQPRSFHARGQVANLIHSGPLGVEQKSSNEDVFVPCCFRPTIRVRKVRLVHRFHPVEKMVKSRALQAEVKRESGMKSDLQLESTSALLQPRKPRGNKVKPEPVILFVKREPEGQSPHVETRPQTRSFRNRVKTEPAEFSVKQEAQVVQESETRPSRRKTSVKVERKSEAEELAHLVKNEFTGREKLRRRKLDQVTERGCSESNSKKSKKAVDLDASVTDVATALVLVDATNVTPASGENCAECATGFAHRCIWQPRT